MLLSDGCSVDENRTGDHIQHSHRSEYAAHDLIQRVEERRILVSEHQITNTNGEEEAYDAVSSNKGKPDSNIRPPLRHSCRPEPGLHEEAQAQVARQQAGTIQHLHNSLNGFISLKLLNFVKSN